jgi:hypothetical protein
MILSLNWGIASTCNMSALGLGCVKTLREDCAFRDLWVGHRSCTVGWLRPDCRDEWLDTDEVHHTGEVVGQHVQGHF